MTEQMQSNRQRFVKRGTNLKSQRLTLTLDDGPLELELRELTAEGRDEMLQACARTNDEGENIGVDQSKLLPAVLIACVFDATTGQPLFTAADRELISGMSASFLDEVFTPAAALSGLTKESQEKLKGNSAATAGSASDSPSPAN